MNQVIHAVTIDPQTLLGTALVLIGGAIMMQNPAVQKVRQAVLGDPRVQDLCHTGVTQLCSAVLDALSRQTGPEPMTPPIG